MNMFRNTTALVTGASSGLGEAYARELARRGTNLVLVARSVDKLNQLASELETQFRVRVLVIQADLTRPEAVEQIFTQTEDQRLEIALLVNNAGFATYGRFETLDTQRELDEIMVNVYAVVALTRRYLPSMLAMRRAAIVNVASTAAFQPLPYMAVYGATKAFVLSYFRGALGSAVRLIGVGASGVSWTGRHQFLRSGRSARSTRW